MSSASALDVALLDRALALALQAYGQTSPNPLVGAVVARTSQVLGEAFHEQFAGHEDVIMQVVSLDRNQGAAGGQKS